MPTGILMVESRPASAADTAAFHVWYENVHIPEMLNIDGFTSARRLQSHDGDSFVAIYEIDTDIDTAKAALAAAQTSGAMTRPTALQLDPPPSVRYLLDFTASGG